MRIFGLDLGGNQIKIGYWNGDMQSSKGVGPEMIENSNGKLTSPYTFIFIINHAVLL